MKFIVEVHPVFTVEEEKIVHNFINFCDEFEKEMNDCVILDEEAEPYSKIEEIIRLPWEDFVKAVARFSEYISEYTKR